MPMNAIFTAVRMSTTPKRGSTHENASTSLAPIAIIAPRIASAPRIPQKSTRCWYIRGIPKELNSIAMTNTLSALSESSTT